MKLMFPEKIRTVAILAIAATMLFFVGSVDAQRRHSAPKKAVLAKKTQVQVRDAKKDARHGNSRVADVKNNKGAAKSVAARRAEAERRRREEERRQAIIAEQRRREQAAREARARKLAFERGLRTETVANISRDNIEGEDLNIRRAAVEALGAHAGSVVVMEAQTGKILTIVNQNWAVRTTIRPCSTIKLVTAAAGLNEGVISKEDGSVRNTSTRRNLDDAIAFSDNLYFQRVGANIGNAKLVEYGRQLGLGQQTGINMDGEAMGRLPYSNSNARIYSHGDDTEVSTIQLAVMVSAITNGGNRVLPRVPRNTIEQARFQPFYKARVEVPQQNIRRMIPGMMGTAEYGTARRGVDSGFGIAGKTGSCIDKGSWVGLFASVAPIESPKYAVAVITRGQGERGKYAAAVAGKVYLALSRNIIRTDRNLAQTEFKVTRKNSVPVKVAIDEGEDEADRYDANADSDVRTAGEVEAPVVIVPSAPRVVTVEKPAPKKLVQNTVDSKPIFAPVVITYPKDRSTKKRERIVQTN